MSTGFVATSASYPTATMVLTSASSLLKEVGAIIICSPTAQSNVDACG